jgi:hypothetical protein
MPKYAELIYNGFWFSPEREALQQLIDRTQEYVSGTVRLKLYKVRGGDGVGGGCGGPHRKPGGGASFYASCQLVCVSQACLEHATHAA